MKQLILTLFLTLLLAGVTKAQEAESRTEARIVDGKVQQVKVTTITETLQEFRVEDDVDLKTLKEKGLLDRLVTEGVVADTSSYPIAVSIFPFIKYENRYKTKVAGIDNETIKRMSEREKAWTSPTSGWLSSLMFLLLPFSLMVIAAKNSVRKEKTKEFAKFSFVSMVGLGLIALSTLPGYGHITNYVESDASALFQISTAALILIGGAIVFAMLINITDTRNYRGSIGAVGWYAFFIILLPKNLYIQALVLYAGLCIFAYLTVKGIDYWLERKVAAEKLATKKT